MTSSCHVVWSLPCLLLPHPRFSANISLRPAPPLPGCGSGETLDAANQPARITMSPASQEEQRSLTSHLINDAFRAPREQKQLTNLPIAPDSEPQLVTRTQRPIGMALGVPALTALPEQLLAPEMQCPRRLQQLLQPTRARSAGSPARPRSRPTSAATAAAPAPW